MTQPLCTYKLPLGPRAGHRENTYLLPEQIQGLSAVAVMLSASPVPGISEIPPSAEKEAHCSRAPGHSRRSREPLSRCHRLQSPGSRLQPLDWPTGWQSGAIGPLGQPLSDTSAPPEFFLVVFFSLSSGPLGPLRLAPSFPHRSHQPSVPAQPPTSFPFHSPASIRW